MKDFYKLFIKYSIQQCRKDDYDKGKKIKANNVASKKLHQLKLEMIETNCTEMLCELLKHEDERVRINAASLCLQKRVIVEEAIVVLKNVIETSDDSTFVFSAKMLLLQFYSA